MADWGGGGRCWRPREAGDGDGEVDACIQVGRWVLTMGDDDGGEVEKGEISGGGDNRQCVLLEEARARLVFLGE